MENVEGVDVLDGHQQLHKELENVLEKEEEVSQVSPPSSSYLFFHQHSISVLYELEEGPPWSILHYDHKALLFHKVVKVGDDVRMFQNGEDLDLHQVT